MVDTNDPIQQARIRALQDNNDALQGNTDASHRLVDPFQRLYQSNMTLASVTRDNISDVKVFRNQLLQSNSVTTKLTDSIQRADSINVKALGNNITLQKVIDQNSVAISESNIGYLRAAEAFIANFSAGIRKTEGGTLRLTEQLIRTGQNTESMHTVNRSLLAMTGRNYDAISEFNDSVLETADTYVMSTDQLLKGIEKLLPTIEKFSLFGPEVASRLSQEMDKVLGKFKGLDEGKLTAFFDLLKPSLEGRRTREMLGLQEFGQAVSQGAVNANQIESNIIRVSKQLQQDIAGREFDVATEIIKAKYDIDAQQAAQLVGMTRLLESGNSNDKAMKATQDDQLKTMQNQKELANRYYEKWAPQMQHLTTGIMAAAIQTAQGVNLIAMANGLRGGTPPGTVINQSTTIPSTGPLTAKQGAAAFDKLQGKTVTAVQGTTNGVVKLSSSLQKVKDTVANSGRSIVNTMKGPMGFLAIGMGLQMLASKIEGDTKGSKLAKDLSSNVGGTVNMLGMGAMMLGKSIPKGLAIPALAAAAIDPITKAMGAEEGDALDSVGDVGKYAAIGAGIGTLIPIPGVGTGIGAGIGALVGILSESMDWDGDQAKRTAKIQENTKKAAQELEAARQAESASMARSDFALKSLVTRVRNSEAALLAAGNQQTTQAVLELTEAVREGNRDRKMQKSFERPVNPNK